MTLCCSKFMAGTCLHTKLLSLIGGKYYYNKIGVPSSITGKIDFLRSQLAHRPGQGKGLKGIITL